MTSGEKKDKLELKEDPNKGVYIKVFHAYSNSRQALHRVFQNRKRELRATRQSSEL